MYNVLSLLVAVASMFIAFCAFYVTCKQSFLGRQQFLFDRRLHIYNVLQQFLVCLSKAEKSLSDVVIDKDVIRNIRLSFMYLCNNTVLEKGQYAIHYGSSDQARSHTSFCICKNELLLMADTVVYVFPDFISDSVSNFIKIYVDVVESLYKCESANHCAVEMNDDLAKYVSGEAFNNVDIDVVVNPVDVFETVESVITSEALIDKIHVLLSYIDVVTPMLLNELFSIANLECSRQKHRKFGGRI